MTDLRRDLMASAAGIVAPPVSHAAPRRFLRIRAVSDVTGLPISTIYAYVARGNFPKQFRIGPRCSAWDEAEVRAWQEARMAERGAA